MPGFPIPTAPKQMCSSRGARLKISQANTARHKDDELTWGDAVWAHWSRSAHVVLTQ